MEERIRGTVRRQQGQILVWIFVFLMGMILILGQVRLYELRLQIQEKQSRLQEMQLELGSLKKQRQQQMLEPEEFADELDMYRPEPEEYMIVHVRGDMEP